LLVSLALLLGVVGPRAAIADEKPAEAKAASGDPKAHYERAVSLYNSGQYDKAIEEFQAVYELRPAPILLFNLAQAHRKAGHQAQALDLYERFLRENPAPDTSKKAENEQYLKLKSETEQYISELKTAIEAEKAAADKAAADKAAADKAAAEKAAADKAAAEKARMLAAAEYRRKYGPRRPLNIAKWTVAGAGVAMVIAGSVLMALDGRPVCPANMPMVPGQILCPSELDTKLTGGLILGGGLLALSGAAVLFVFDYRQLRAAGPPPMLALNLSF
jgi:tetratricopeptide (TPR) repeat protein